MAGETLDDRLRLATINTGIDNGTIVLYKVFTPTRNALDLSRHRSNKEHTNARKRCKDTYVAVVEKYRLDGAIHLL